MFGRRERAKHQYPCPFGQERFKGDDSLFSLLKIYYSCLISSIVIFVIAAKLRGIVVNTKSPA